MITEIKKFLDKQNKDIAALYKIVQLAYWKAMITGKPEAYKEFEKENLRFAKFFHNKENFEKIKKFLKQEISDEIIKRELKVLYDGYLGSQGDWNLIQELIKKVTEMEKKFNVYRAKIRGKEYTDNEIKEILKTETNSKKLRVAWEASKKQGALVEKELIEIIKLRNKLARSLGFDNYYSLSLEVGEQKEQEIAEIFKELEELTDKPFKKLKQEIDEYLASRCGIKTEELKPWHYHDRFFQEGPEIYKFDLDKFYKKDVIKTARKYYDSLGLDVKGILERSDLYEKKGKYQHACCMDIDRKGDVRIIQNVKNNERWMEVTLHELGHAVYNKYLDPDLPFIIRDVAHTFTTEAIAMIFGRKSKSSSFIKNHGSGNENIEDISKMLRLRQLVFSRWVQVMFHFERQLYKNPDQDLNKLWWKLIKKYQLIDFERDKPDWASKIHFVSAPVYYHNYALGELLASQLHHYIIKNILKTDKETDYSNKKEVGKFLEEKVFKPSARYRWDEMIKRATGEELTPRYFVEQFVKGK
jgi:peptidyl-dipeptidase A